MTREIMLTVEAGKRLIARGIAAEPSILTAAREHKLIIVAGTTNGYVAQALFEALGAKPEFDQGAFRRGVTVAPGAKLPKVEKAYDVLIDHGEVHIDADIAEVAPQLGAGDVILKGANAYHQATGECGVLIGHPAGGTTIPIISAHIGKRVGVVIPVGLEKRVDRPISELCAICNATDAAGSRLVPLPGRAYTELDAIRALTGAEATLIAAGGFMGAEGCVYIAVTGTEAQLDALKTLGL